MPQVAVRIPQIGEGLQEARLVAVLKQPGDKIRRDEPIYQMETDKAVMDVESPFEGTLVKWLAPVDTILPIGGEVAIMEVAEGVEEIPAAHGHAPTAAPVATPAAAVTTDGPRRTDIPPRTRAYAKEKGVPEDVLATIAASGSKLMPDDIDAFLAGGAPVAAKAMTSNDHYREHEVPSGQRVLNSRMVRGSAICVPGTIMVAVRWDAVEAARAHYKNSGDDFKPSAFTMVAFAVAQAVKNYPSFRTILVGDNVFRTYNQLQLGIAVGLPGDDLVLAVVDDADGLNWIDFAKRSREKIELARTGKDQATEAVTLSLTNMQSYGLRDAVPVVVPPSMATLFLGEVYTGIEQGVENPGFVKYVNLALTFDHRILNGVGASNFINDIKAKIENIGSLIGV